MKEPEKLESILQVKFQDQDLLRRALTHRSFINENRQYPPQHNERLEFLGDAVLELVVTEFLYNKFPEKTEGELTAYRAALVNTTTLSTASLKLKLNDFILLSKGESKDVGRARQYILANTFESIVGAIYMDQGYEEAKQFIARNLFGLIEEIVEKRLWQDAKSHLQEMAQDKIGVTPSYSTIKEKGPDHSKIFTVGVYLGGELIASGDGASKQEAEQEAASKAIEVKKWNQKDA
jgi:ribonuclease III